MEVTNSCLGDGVGEEEAGEVEAGLDPGPAEAHLATYHHGKDQAGYSAASAGDSVDGGDSLIIRGLARGFRGSQGGGGQTQHTTTVSCTRT